MRTTVAEMGPLLLSRLLELTEAQEGILNIAFRISDEQGYPLLDLKDLQPHGVIRERAWDVRAVSGSKMWDRHSVKHWLKS